MTFLLAAGLTKQFCASPLARRPAPVVLTQRTAIYVLGGVLMMALRTFTLLGGQMRLPMPGRLRGKRPRAFYARGRLVGVEPLLRARPGCLFAVVRTQSSFGGRSALGSPTLFRMVAPLFAIALL